MKILLDMFLLPRSLYNKITDGRLTLFLGFLLVGAVDLVYPYLVNNYSSIFSGKPSGTIMLNIIIAAAAIILLGIIDVVCFSVPLADLFKRFRKEEGFSPAGNFRIKVMKVYIIMHFYAIAANVIFDLLFKDLGEQSSVEMISLAFYTFMFILVWLTAIISRGINSIYAFVPPFKRLVFPVVFMWSYLEGMAISYIIENWIMKLLA